MTTPSGTSPIEPPPENRAPRPSLRRRLSKMWGDLDGGGKGAVLAAIIGVPAALAGILVPILTAGGDSQASGENKPSLVASVTPGVSADQPTAAPASASASESARSSAAPASAPSASLSPEADTIQYTGVVRIAEDGPDLDQVPPSLDPYDYDVQLGLVDPPRIFAPIGQPTLALWPGPGTPTRQQCANLVSTTGVKYVSVKKGTVVCLRTDAGRMAVLTILSTTNGFDTGELAQASVWSEPVDHS